MTGKLLKENFTLKESQCTIISDRQEAIQAAKESIKRNYQELEIYVRANPKFLHSLMPIPVPEKPLVAKLMAQASEKAGVGPMAGVAGAIADLAVEDMKHAGCEVAVVEDGGEISADSTNPLMWQLPPEKNPSQNASASGLPSSQSASPPVQDVLVMHLVLGMLKRRLFL